MSSPASAHHVASNALDAVATAAGPSAATETTVVGPAMAVPALTPAAPAGDRSRNRIQVSREKRPLNFFVGLAKKFLINEDEIELSGLGLAVTTVVTVVEILRAAGQVGITRMETSLVDSGADGRATAPKAKIQVWVHKGPRFGQPAAARDPPAKSTASAATRSVEDTADTQVGSSLAASVAAVEGTTPPASTPADASGLV